MKILHEQFFLQVLFLTCFQSYCWGRNIVELNNEVDSGVPSKANHDNFHIFQRVKHGNDDPGPPYMVLPPAKPATAPISLEQGLLKELTKKIGNSYEISSNGTRGRNNSLSDDLDADLFTEYVRTSKPVLFTIGSSDTGLRWNQIPYREKYQWDNPEAPCHPFKLRVPTENENQAVLDVCIYRDHLDFQYDDLLIVKHQEPSSDEKKEMKVVGQVDGVHISTVIGNIVDTYFYGEISVQDPVSKKTTVYLIEEMKYLSQLIHHNGKVMKMLLTVMNSGANYPGPTVKYNAVLTQGFSMVNLISSENRDEVISKPLFIISTGHNSYIAPGEVTMTIEDSGRIKFASPGNIITIDLDGSIQFKTDNKEYTFRPNGRTILKEGMKVHTLQEHEGSVALTAFSSTNTYSCVLPTPAFSFQKQGGYICKVCLATDTLFEQYFALRQKDSELSSSKYLGQIIDKVSWIFRSTDWNDDGVADNIGLDWDTQFFQWSNPNDNKEEAVSEDELDVLFKSLTNVDFSECCLGIAYTMKRFPDSIFAQSSASKTAPIGGACSARSQGVSNNVILISANDKSGNFEELTEEKLVYITAHEIAKAFGASDDLTGQLECDQFKQDAGSLGHFIMWPDVIRNVSPAEKSFSPCSKKSITETMASCKSACFEINKHPFCGNGIVEDSEECDCGDEYSCSIQKCCYSRNDKYPCRKTGIKCKVPSNAYKTMASGISVITPFLIMFIVSYLK